MAGERQRAIDEDREIDVHLDQALRVTAIPVVGVPALLGHELQGEALVRRQVDACARAPPALGEHGSHHLLQAAGGDGMACAKCFDALGERTRPGRKRFDPPQDRIEMREWFDLQPHRKQTLGLDAERRPDAVDHVEPEPSRANIGLQVTQPPDMKPVVP
ncbi:MAG: hypothetical protein KIT16_05525 [Rhodospirillaceae bacterium]|nr:hypothetical protein [Rhodospirillaceae bacterium]